MKLRIKEVYSQRDPKWFNVLLGFNTQAQYNLGNYGCLVASVAMYLSALDYKETPETLNTKLKKVNGFVNGGYYVWDALEKIYSDVKVDYQSPKFDSLDDVAILKMKSLLDAGYPLICEVDFNPSQVGDQMHWVLVYGYQGDNFYIADPWRGALVNLSVYGALRQAVTSFRTYSRTLPKDNLEPTLPPNEDPCKEIKEDKEYWKDEAKKARSKANSRQEEIDKLVAAQEILIIKHRQELEDQKQVCENELAPLKNALKEANKTIEGFDDVVLEYERRITELKNKEYTLEDCLSFVLQWFIRKIKSIWYTTEGIPSVEELEEKTKDE